MHLLLLLLLRGVNHVMLLQLLLQLLLDGSRNGWQERWSTKSDSQVQRVRTQRWMLKSRHQRGFAVQHQKMQQHLQRRTTSKSGAIFAQHALELGQLAVSVRARTLISTGASSKTQPQIVLSGGVRAAVPSKGFAARRAWIQSRR